MNRFIALLLGSALLVTTSSAVLAGKPARSCPNPASGWAKVDPAGWWEASVEGFAVAGIPVYVGGDPANGFTVEFDALAVSFGFADGQAFHDFILGEQWDGLDDNADGFVCMKAPPINPANPGFFFGAIDNVAR